LSETKAAPFVTTPILRQLGYTLMVHAPPAGSQGGLLLAWKPDVNIVTFSVICNTICVWILLLLNACLLLFMVLPTRIFAQLFGQLWLNLVSLILIRGFALGILIPLILLKINLGVVILILSLQTYLQTLWMVLE